ncbi:MAG TPA: biosynthetic arginine decarboxylase [Arcobacter sp.]|nr:biosynthetic arginine decarboxylase [Arcobacter sp.]HIP55403.1 biosynthetic arginine decarboxylase [Arcobacter sp.]
MNNYGLDIWGDDNFIIQDGVVKLNISPYPAVVDIVKELRAEGNKCPLLLRFPHITQKQISKLYTTFNDTIKEYDYKASFKALFPLKVNQNPNFLLPLLKNSEELNYGLEAGSKAELILAMAYNNKNAPITVNGFKDKEIITLGFIAKQQGHNITLTIEGINELKTIIEVYNELNLPCPNIGLRVRLHSSGDGIWAKSGGINSKFGLSATEILDAFELVKEYNMLESLTMIHFHIGSSMSNISPLKKALKESGHIYAQLKQLGANNLKAINIGGGLAIEYSQFQSKKQYSLAEFCSDVVFTLKDIAQKNDVEEPDIYTESGRFIAAPNTILITPVLELFSSDYDENSLRPKEVNPEIIKELYSLYNEIKVKTAREYMHDSLDHLESILTLFDLGYVDLQDRSNAEVLTHLIIKKAIQLLEFKDYTELKNIEQKIQEKYLLNFSIFQSLPDFWGIGQNFPVMPLTKLNTIPTRSSTLWDITCDSDGEIPFNPKEPLYLHDVDLEKEEYFLGFFLVGAYQDILGMKHNLFTSPTEVNIDFEKDKYKLSSLIKSQKTLDIFEDLDYDIEDLQNRLFSKIQDENLKDILNNYLNDNGYLKTTEIK